jgi:hypothetical protein
LDKLVICPPPLPDLNPTIPSHNFLVIDQYVERPKNKADFKALMAQLDYAHPGKVFSREELNER